MGLLENITNKIQYELSTLGYDPNAEKFAKEKQQKEAKEALRKERESKEQELQKVEEEARKAKEKADKERLEQNANEMSITPMITSMVGTSFSIVSIGLLIGIGILGASLATNLNVYREWTYRLYYLVYGFLFSPIVILYVYLYRWWWKGKRPRFYALFPLVPYRLNHPWTAQFFSWLSYRPDDQVDALKEWRDV
jgi:hypothetical protein